MFDTHARVLAFIADTLCFVPGSCFWDSSFFSFTVFDIVGLVLKWLYSLMVDIADI